MAEEKKPPSAGTPKKELKEMSMEVRMLLAFILMGAVLFLTPYFYKPAPPQKGAPAAAKQQPAPAATPAPKPSPSAAAAEAPPAPAEPVAAAKEETHVIETNLYRVVFSNRGAVVRSWMLKQYRDNAKKPVDLVNAAAASKTGYPFSIQFKGRKPDADLNQALFSAAPGADGLSIEFTYSDGKAAARKSFRFNRDKYLSEISSEVRAGGEALPHLLTWRGGFGDFSVFNAFATQHTLFFDLQENKLIVNEAKAAKDGPVSHTGPVSFAGLEDTYFAAVALPETGAPFEIQTWQDKLPVAAHDNKEEPHVGAALGGQGRNGFSFFAGPKELETLRGVNPKLEQAVDFGFFAFLAKPLFLALHWVNDKYIHSYGWSIVLVTIAINLLMLPLKLGSLKSMTKMQSLQPQIAAINARYKDVPLRDPRKNQQNQEIMDLYKKHGVNPLGGCVPMLLQIPFFIAFYKVLSVVIELRGASWLWVADLSQPEQYAIRILPLAMIGTQFWLQKMTPSTTADPTQQRIMLLMPLMLGFMFYSASSGLVLYWLTGNVVGILQQWLFNRKWAPPAAAVKPAPKKGGGK